MVKPTKDISQIIQEFTARKVFDKIARAITTLWLVGGLSLLSKVDAGTKGILKPGQFLWPRALAWGAILFVMAKEVMTASIGVPARLHFADPWSMPIAVALPIFGLSLYAFLVKGVERRNPSELRLNCAALELLIGGMAGIAFIASIMLLLVSLGLYAVGFGQWRHWPQMLVYNSYISGVMEELAFRAVILRIAIRLLGPVAGVAISSILFGVAHMGHVPLFAAAQMMMTSGLIFSLLYFVSGRLWLCIGMHTAIDFAAWSLLGDGGPHGLLRIAPIMHRSAILTGGAAGPERSLPAILVAWVFVALILLVGRNRSHSPTLIRKSPARS